MNFAIIRYQGKQFSVEEGQELTLDRVDATVDSKIVFEEVLLVKNDDALLIGQPTVSKATVTGVVLAHPRAEKVRVATYKAKSRVRKTKGFRHDQTVVRIDSISVK